MAQKQFRIGELAQQLAVEQFVIRFWEKEFTITSKRSSGGQRFYTQKDLQKFTLIKELLYTRGFTIAGAKAQLDQESAAAPTELRRDKQLPIELKEKLLALRELLIKLRNFREI